MKKSRVNVEVLFLMSFFLFLTPYSALSAPGDLDLTFSGDGFDTYPGPYAGLKTVDVAIQPDAKIVVIGSSYNGLDDDILLLRYNVDGTRDETFGTAGAVTYDSGSDDYGHGVVLSPDGKVWVATIVNGQMAILRFNENGAIDDSFGSNGVVIPPGYGRPGIGKPLALQSDGKIVVVGYNGDSDDHWWILLTRFNSDGTLDTSFGVEGTATYETSAGNFGDAVAIQPDGNIVVAGRTFTESTEDVLVLRFDETGSPDAAFGENGVVTYDSGAADQAFEAAIQSDGKIVVVGSTFLNGDNLLVLRYNSDGTLDDSFDGDGVVTVNGLGHSIALQPDGKILVAGLGSNPLTRNSDLLVLRIESNGTLDTTFGVEGVVFFNGPDNSEDDGQGIALQADGRIVVTGRTGFDDDILILRLIGYSISLAAPEHGVIFDSSSVITGHQPVFSWTSTEMFKRYTILFSVSPSDFKTEKILILKADVDGKKNRWKPDIASWVKIMKASHNRGTVREIYWKVIGKRPKKINRESTVRKFQAGSPQVATINSPAEGAVLDSRGPHPFSINLNSNPRVTLEFSPLADFSDPARIKGFSYKRKDPVAKPVMDITFTWDQWTSVKNLLGTQGYFRVTAWDGMSRTTFSEVRTVNIYYWLVGEWDIWGSVRVCVTLDGYSECRTGSVSDDFIFHPDHRFEMIGTTEGKWRERPDDKYAITFPYNYLASYFADQLGEALGVRVIVTITSFSMRGKENRSEGFIEGKMGLNMSITIPSYGMSGTVSEHVTFSGERMTSDGLLSEREAILSGSRSFVEIVEEQVKKAFPAL